ncbi:hypothetical protein AQI70_03975 [Streptomyces curacoi]|uniref:Uncharacterized protein n=1 Tax=Streptomyces curacoi TaxID=146536 RepID=A0A117PK88_9ACTN|nr:hypothetical protein AQI70_03975 [Streptomyces curacoi]
MIYSTGDHDERQAFAKVLGSGHLDPDGSDRADALVPSAGGERAAVSLVDGHRFVTLDSLVPGKGYGHLGRTQLDWLRDVLRTPRPHPPCPRPAGRRDRLRTRRAAALFRQRPARPRSLTPALRSPCLPKIASGRAGERITVAR